VVLLYFVVVATTVGISVFTIVVPMVVRSVVVVDVGYGVLVVGYGVVVVGYGVVVVGYGVLVVGYGVLVVG
jgi:hypothetical protein